MQVHTTGELHPLPCLEVVHAAGILNAGLRCLYVPAASHTQVRDLLRTASGSEDDADTDQFDSELPMIIPINSVFDVLPIIYSARRR